MIHAALLSGCSNYRLYKERMGQVDHKLEEVRAGRAAEYLNPLSQLQENMTIRTEVAGETRNLGFFSLCLSMILSLIYFLCISIYLVGKKCEFLLNTEIMTEK